MRRQIRSALVVGASAVVALGPLAGIANAETTAPQPTAAYAGGAVVSNGTTATVRVVYTCTSTVSPGSHLFVAVKQGPGVSPENPSSESGDVRAFLSTNWNSDQGPNALVCDGKRHLQKIELEQQPGFTGGPLTTGPALVQICVYDNITGMNGYEPIGGFAASYTMEKVVVTHAPSKF